MKEEPYHVACRRRITVLITRDLLSKYSCAWDIFVNGSGRLLGYEWDYERDVLGATIFHPELDLVPPYQLCMSFTYEEALLKFPYLFCETNPILYRQFENKESWYEIEKRRNKK